MFGVIPATLEEAAYDAQHHPLVGLIGAAPYFAPTIDHSHHLDLVPDQGPSSSCVAQWFSTAIYLAGQAQGKPVPRPSRRWSYNVARYMSSPGVLIDGGSSARLMCLGSERHGIIAESRLPFDAALINEPPPFDADIAGADALFKSYHRTDVDVSSQLRRSLERGHFPGVAINVFQNFMDWGRDGRVYDEPEGSFRGLHMLTLLGYRPGAFRVLNSWGTGWAEGGCIWMSDRFIASQYTFDRYVVTAAPLSR